MQSGKLSNNEARDFTDFITFDYVDLQTTGFLSTIGAANQRIIGSNPSGGAIGTFAFVQLIDPAGASDLTIDVGTTSADPDEFIDNLDVDAMTKCAYNTGEAYTGEAGATDPIGVTNVIPNNTASAVPIYMEFNGTLASLTAGKWRLAWQTYDPGRFN